MRGLVLAFVYGPENGAALLGLVGGVLVVIGFKVWRDSCSNSLPAELRPSAWHAVAVWVLASLLFVWASKWWNFLR